MVRKVYKWNSSLVECINPVANTWMVLWGKNSEGLDRGEEVISYLSETVDHKPTLEEVKSIITNWYNSIVDQEILTGYTWQGIPVWLSLENQVNYKAIYDLSLQNNDELLPVTIKLGTTDNTIYYTFDDIDTLKEFYIGAVKHIQSALAKGWEVKKEIDWSIYKNSLE